MFDQIQFSADQGFRAWEDNRVHERPIREQTAIGKKLEQNGMTMGVFVAFGIGRFEDPAFVSQTDREYQDMLRGHMRNAVEVAKRVGATWCTVVPGAVNQNLDPGYQFANCVANLKAMSEVCEPSGLVMVLEPLNWYKNHPGLFLRTVPRADVRRVQGSGIAVVQNPRRPLSPADRLPGNA
ncbi:MAG: TIM barrel protein [Bryobacterales bacterium]